MQKIKLAGLVAGAAAISFLTQCITPPQNEGERLYTQHCANCHMDDGSGLRNLIPPLAQADYLVTHRDKLACLIKHGQQGEIIVNGVTYNHLMPANEGLSEVDITNLLNYVQQNFGNQNKLFSPVEVKEALKRCRH